MDNNNTGDPFLRFKHLMAVFEIWNVREEVLNK